MQHLVTIPVLHKTVLCWWQSSTFRFALAVAESVTSSAVRSTGVVDKEFECWLVELSLPLLEALVPSLLTSSAELDEVLFLSYLFFFFWRRMHWQADPEYLLLSVSIAIQFLYRHVLNRKGTGRGLALFSFCFKLFLLLYRFITQSIRDQRYLAISYWPSFVVYRTRCEQIQSLSLSNNWIV